MLGVAAQRIVNPIRKPRNNANEAIAAKPGWDGAFRAICCVAPLANGGLPLASRRFVHLIPESLRRDHAGLVQRFPNCIVVDMPRCYSRVEGCAKKLAIGACRERGPTWYIPG